MPQQWITVKSIRALYSAYRLLPPFNTWHLPPAYDLKFKIVHDDDYAGGIDEEPQLTMYISVNRQSFLQPVTVTIMHEMVHLHLLKMKDPKWAEHGREFKKCAKQISSLYGFDPVEF